MCFYDILWWKKPREDMCLCSRSTSKRSQQTCKTCLGEMNVCVLVLKQQYFPFYVGADEWQMKGFERTQNEIRLFWKMFSYLHTVWFYDGNKLKLLSYYSFICLFHGVFSYHMTRPLLLYNLIFFLLSYVWHLRHTLLLFITIL